MFRTLVGFSILCVCFAGAPRCWGDDTPAAELFVGVGEADITPDPHGERPVWLAGYGQNRRAEGVHDPLYVRALVLRSGEQRIALASVDVVGLQYPQVCEIRAALPEYAYVMVASTHNHEAPDTIGLWGPNPLQTGVDSEWLAFVVAQTVAAIRAAEAAGRPAVAAYGVAEDETLLGDSRLPKVYDGVLRALRFDDPQTQQTHALLVQWNCHPEALGSDNLLLTADFPWATIAGLREKYGVPVVYFTGAVGGLMAPPHRDYRDEQGRPLADETFAYAEAYGREVAELAALAIDCAAPIALVPWTISARTVAVPVENKLYQLARSLGVLRRSGRVWQGDSDELGPELNGSPEQAGATMAVESEVAYLRLGELHVACIPGEIYPELVYGRFQEPAEPNADFPDAPLEPHVMGLLPGEKTLLFGLANDEVGYIIPKRQWDQAAPYAFGRATPQYGEINSCGPDVAAVVLEALRRRIAEAAQ